MYLTFFREGIDHLPRCLVGFSPFWLCHQLYATIKLEPHYRRDGDTTSEICGGRAVQRGE